MKLIIRKDRLLTHIGIYVDDEHIYHFSSKTNNFFANDKIVKCDTLTIFSRKRKIRIIKVDKDTNNKDIYIAARNFPGRIYSYDIIRNNCYTFVLWCLFRKKMTNIEDILIFTHHYKIPILSFFI